MHPAALSRNPFPCALRLRTSRAAIATILALHQINIKNIGISHNREQEDGVLKVEFYQKEEIEKAREILTAKGYSVYLQ